MKMKPFPDLSEGACVGIPVEMFYTGTHDNEESPVYQDKELALRVCQSCPVIEECLTWALHHERWGIWGGTDTGTRERMRREMRIPFHDPMSETPAK
jgi:WhiB family redox-sensing transcriptional regulator